MLDETLLDSPDALGRADVRGLLRDTAEAGARVRTALRQAHEAGLAGLRPDGRPRAVLVAGSSPAAGCVADLLGALGRGSLPVSLLRPTGARYGADALRWTLPGWAGPLDLLLVATPDGTENGLYGLVEQAYRRGCSVVTVCPDAAPLAEVSRGTHGLAVPLDRSPAPARRPESEPTSEPEQVPGHEEAQSTAARRTAETVTPGGFWALFTPLVVLYGRLGLFDAEEADAVRSLADRLDRVAERCGPTLETYENPAKTLAAELSGGLPLLWSEGPLAHTAARHCATAHTALAGLPALAAELPEALALHGALLEGAYAAGASEEDFFRDRVEDPEPRHARVVLLSEEPAPADGSAPPADDPSSERPSSSSLSSPSPSPDSALPAARDLAYAHGVPIGELRPARPGSPLETAAELLATADFAVVYLALAGSGP